jgi:hypothetical protein
MPKDQGGLWVLDLEKMNIVLLSKCLWKLFNEDGIWKKNLRRKYLQKQTLCHAVAKNGDSCFWQGLLEIKHFFWNYCRVQVGDRLRTSFWEDQWIGTSCLARAFPRLFTVSVNRNVTVQEVFDKGVNGLRFRRAMVGELREQWVELKKNLQREYL